MKKASATVESSDAFWFHFPKWGWLFIVVLVVEVEVVIVIDIARLGELGERAPLLLCGATKTFLPIYESANARHLQQIVLALGSDILEIFGNQFCSHAVLDETEHPERVGDGRLPHIHYLAHLQGPRWFHCHAIDSDASFLACLGGDCASFEDARRPQPFVNSHHVYLLLKWFIAKASPERQNALIASTAVGIFCSIILLSSSLKVPRTYSTCIPRGKSLPIPNFNRV